MCMLHAYQRGNMSSRYAVACRLPRRGLASRRCAGRWAGERGWRADRATDGEASEGRPGAPYPGKPQDFGRARIRRSVGRASRVFLPRHRVGRPGAFRRWHTSCTRSGHVDWLQARGSGDVADIAEIAGMDTAAPLLAEPPGGLLRRHPPFCGASLPARR